MGTVFDILVNYHVGFLSGLAVTFKLFAIIAFFGVGIGSALGWLSHKNHEVKKPVQIIGFILAGIPILVFLMWMHYPLQAMLGIVVDPFYTAALTFTVINIFAVADLVMKTMNDFPSQYLTAAKVCGLTQKQTILKIQYKINHQRMD